VSERAVPVKELNDNCNDQTRNMENPDRPALYPPECTKDKKEYPEKMDENDPICKNPVMHPPWNIARNLHRGTLLFYRASGEDDFLKGTIKGFDVEIYHLCPRLKRHIRSLHHLHLGHRDPCLFAVIVKQYIGVTSAIHGFHHLSGQCRLFLGVCDP